MKNIKQMPDSENVKKWICFCLWLIQLFFSISAIIAFRNSGLFPMRILVLLCIACTLISVIIFLLIKKNKRQTYITGALMSIIVIVCVVYVLNTIKVLIGTLNSISNSDIQTESVIAVVLEDSKVDNIGEAGSLSFGCYFGSNSDALENANEDIKEKCGNNDLNMEKYESFLKLANALMNKDIDVAVFSKGYSSLLEDAFPEFESITKIIYESDYQVVLKKQEEREEKRIEADVEKGVLDDSLNIYISGIDVDGPISAQSRSDVNIIMTVNPFTNTILLTSTPRDYYVYIPGVSGNMRDKLTHAGVYGIDASISTLENLYDIKIDNYLRINFDSLIKLVDAIGGVDVYSEYAFSGRGCTFTKGINHLDGEEALVFARERYAFIEGDNQRGKNQMAVIQAIIAKLQSPVVLKNSAEVLSVVEESMQTDFSFDEISEMISWQLAKGTDWNVEQQVVYGAGDKQETYSMPGRRLYVMWPNEQSVSEAAVKINAVKDMRADP